VSVPLRAAPSFPVAEYVTVPLPAPEAPDVIERNGVSLELVQKQPSAAATEIAAPAPPVVPTLSTTGATV